MHEAGEILERVQWIVNHADNQLLVQTPDGRDPVYWPVTVYGRSAMFEKYYVDGVEIEVNDLKPPRP